MIKCALETYSSEGKQIRIQLVAMTIPSQWDLNFEEVYRRMFKRAFLQTFDETPEAASHDLVVGFHTEATALAQYIFHESSHEAALGGGMPLIGTILGKSNAQCLIDCGGHNSHLDTVRPSRPEPCRDPVTPYSAAQKSAAFENRRDPSTNRRNGDYYRPSTDTAGFPDLAAPSRRPVGSRDYLFSNRYRDRDPESSVRNGMAELNLNHGVSASGSRPRVPAPAAPPHRRDTAAPRAAPAGNFGSRSLHVDSRLPGPSSRPTPESSPAGSSQYRRRFGPRGSGKGGGHPPSSD